MQARMPGVQLLTAHYLERDPDVLLLRRLDGSLVGAFRAHDDAGEKTRHDESPSAHRSRLRVRFFGGFEATLEGEALPLNGGGKAEAILRYLLANRDRPVSRDLLMAWQWPDSSPRKARWSLNSAVHGLRKLLNDRPGESPDYLLLEDGYYRLSPLLRIETDVDAFDAHYAEGLRLERLGRRAEAAAAYEGAVELVGGEYLIEDLYDDWSMVERERLSNACTDALERLAGYHLESGRPREAVRFCYRVLERDRYHEATHRLLIRSYTALGMRSRALRQYRLCEELLARDYGLAPTPETRALRHGITAGHTIDPAPSTGREDEKMDT